LWPIAGHNCVPVLFKQLPTLLRLGTQIYFKKAITLHALYNLTTRDSSLLGGKRANLDFFKAITQYLGANPTTLQLQRLRCSRLERLLKKKKIILFSERARLSLAS
jgi:hypothetical protein